MTNRKKFKELNKIERDLFNALDSIESFLYKTNATLQLARNQAETLISFTDDEIRGTNE